MEIQTSGHPVTALLLASLSGITGMLAAVVTNIDLWIRGGSFLIAVVSGLMAIRYYYYATKKIIKETKI